MSIEGPKDPSLLIVVAHGSAVGVARRARAVQLVADALGAATAAVPMLTPEEAARDSKTNAVRFDIGRLADRLGGALDAVEAQGGAAARLPMVVWSSGTGVAAALVAAAKRKKVRAVVGLCGRPDLAGPVLPDVRAEALFVVGGRDLPGVRANLTAMRHLVRSHLVLVPGGSATLAAARDEVDVANVACAWLLASVAPLRPRASAGAVEHARR